MMALSSTILPTLSDYPKWNMESWLFLMVFALDNPRKGGFLPVEVLEAHAWMYPKSEVLLGRLSKLFGMDNLLLL